MSARPDFRNPRSTEFRRVTAAFLSQPGLPFASVLSAERIGRIFARHGNLFGLDQIYSTAVMVWSFLCQVLQDGKGASCPPPPWNWRPGPVPASRPVKRLCCGYFWIPSTKAMWP